MHVKIMISLVYKPHNMITVNVMSRLNRSNFIKKSKLTKKINLRSSVIVYYSVKVIKMLILKGITLGGFCLEFEQMLKINFNNSE